MTPFPLTLFQAFELLSISSFSTLAIVAIYLFIRNYFYGKYDMSYPILGDKESTNLREIVEKQWSKVRPQYPIFYMFRVSTNTVAGRTRSRNIYFNCLSANCMYFPIILSMTMQGSQNMKYVSKFLNEFAEQNYSSARIANFVWQVLNSLKHRPSRTTPRRMDSFGINDTRNAGWPYSQCYHLH